MKLNIAEKFLIIAHHPEKGRFKVNGYQLKYGLVGALLLEMSLEKIVSVQDKRLVYNSSGGDKDPVIAGLAAMIRQSGKVRKVRSWISKFAFRSNRLRWAVLTQMADKRIIRIESRRFLGIIPYRCSYITDSNIRAELIREARSNVFEHRDLSEENVALLGLIEACGMHRIISNNRQEIKMIKKELKEIIKKSPIAEMLSVTLNQVRTAVMVSAAASSAAASG